MEPRDFFIRPVESGCEPVINIICMLHGFIQVFNPCNSRNRDEHFVFPQAMIERQIGNQGWFTEKSLIVIAAGQDLAAGEEISSLADLFRKILEILDMNSG